MEENAVAGGAGSAVNEYLAASGRSTALLNIGLTDVYVEHASREECLSEAGLDASGIERQVRERLQRMGRESGLRPASSG